MNPSASKRRNTTASRWVSPTAQSSSSRSSTCGTRSEEHTSELQSQSNLVCRLLLEKKKIVAALIGFCVKACIVPLHVWLPYAHPAAPSHISALLSCVMIDDAIYAPDRESYDLLVV